MRMMRRHGWGQDNSQPHVLYRIQAEEHPEGSELWPGDPQGINCSWLPGARK